MIQLDLIKNFFPTSIRNNAIYDKHILKEYIQLMILDFLSTSPFISKIAFIGGTNLRLVKGIDRFSEDFDFDCKKLSKEEFIEMTDSVLRYLERSGFNIVVKDRENSKLTAFRRSYYFPELLFDLGISGYKEKGF